MTTCTVDTYCILTDSILSNTSCSDIPYLTTGVKLSSPAGVGRVSMGGLVSVLPLLLMPLCLLLELMQVVRKSASRQPETTRSFLQGIYIIKAPALSIRVRVLI